MGLEPKMSDLAITVIERGEGRGLLTDLSKIHSQARSKESCQIVGIWADHGCTSAVLRVVTVSREIG